jgi:hypothetical protein
VWRHLYGRDWGHHHHHHHGQTQHSADGCLPAKAGLWREAYLQRWVESAATAAAELHDAANAATTALASEAGPGSSADVERTSGPKRPRCYGGHHRRGEGPILLGRRRQPAGPWEDADHHRRQEEEERGRPRPAKRSKPQRRRNHDDEEEQQQQQQQQQQEAEWREAMLRAYFAAIDRESLTEADE